MRCAAMIRPIVLAILACALTTHDAAGQSVTGFSPSSGVIQVPATGPGAQVITIHNADTVEALFVDLPALSWFEWAEVSTVVGYCDTTFQLPWSGSVRVFVDLGSTCILSVAVLATPPPGQSVEEDVTLYAAGSAMLSASYTLRATASGGGGGPANDEFADAEDLSGLAIPPYVAVEHPWIPGVFQPGDTVSVAGTTVGSTREPYEYGTVVNEDGSETPPPAGTVWFRYTPPQGGFAGRLGYRVTPGFFVAPVVQRPGATEPMPDVRGTDFSPGNAWPPSGLQFVRMEPGHSVWFQVSADVETASGTPVWTDGPFTLELYQAPNEQDSILNAYSITGADNPDGTGRPWPDGLGWVGDGDTYHLTADQPGGPPNMWFTASFDRPGLWTFRALSAQANRNVSTRPLGVRLYRAPTGQRVSDPSELTFVQGTGGSEICCFSGFDHSLFPPGPVWSSALVDVPVEPGRYYWSVDEGAQGPTFYSLLSSYRAVAAPPPSTVVAWQSTSAGAIAEGGLHQIQIRRSGDLSAASTITFAIRGGTATTDDIGLVRGTSGLGGFADLGTGFGTHSVTFSPGAEYVVLGVASAQDSVVEPDETFVLELLSATGATLGDPSLRTATGTILNDDVLPVIAFQSTGAGAIAEGGLHQIQIARTGNLAAASTVTFAIRGGTATTDDIGMVRGTSVSGGLADLGTGLGTYSLTFNPGVGYVVLEVASAQDGTIEPDETFVLELLSATGATLGDPSLRVATGTILNDDVPPPPSCATDLSGILSVTKGPMRYVWVRQRFEQAITLTNTSTTTIQPPVHVAVALDGLGAHVTMVNASGVTSCATPAGSPYLVFPVRSDIPWGPGVRVTISNLAFTTTQNLPITYTTRVLGGTSR